MPFSRRKHRQTVAFKRSPTRKQPPDRQASHLADLKARECLRGTARDKTMNSQAVACAAFTPTPSASPIRMKVKKKGGKSKCAFFLLFSLLRSLRERCRRFFCSPLRRAPLLSSGKPGWLMRSPWRQRLTGAGAHDHSARQ